MAVGSILKEQLLATKVLTVKLDEDILLGELVCDDGAGAGVIAATAALIADGMTVYMSTEAHVYATVEAAGGSHDIVCVEVGYVECIKVAGNDIYEGNQVIVSATAGAADLYVAPVAGSSYVAAEAQAVYDLMANVIGRCTEDVASAILTMKILIGVK